MKILFCGNCQASALSIFVARGMPQHEVRHLPHLATFYGEFSEEHIADQHAWADLVFFHHKHDGAQAYPTKQPKVPLSVFYQGGPFIAEAHDDDWTQVREYAALHGRERAIQWAVTEADMGYTRRWRDNLARMIEKEEEEKIAPEIRMSDIVETEGRLFQQQRTMNHPTSIVFREWANRIMRFMREEPARGAVTREEALREPNIGGLPCEQSATSGAVKHLGLRWGGRGEDEQSGREIALTKLQ